MIVSIIVAMDDRRGIGRENRIPWHLPADLQRFKEITMKHHIIMGRKTFESIGKPLPGRTNIVVTRKLEYRPDGVIVVHTIGSALDFAKRSGESEVFIIGGADIYRQAMPYAEQLYLTHVHLDSKSDIFFPEIGQEWNVLSSEEIPVDDKNEYPSTFRIYVKS